MNGSTCVDGACTYAACEFQFSCTCASGWAGQFCEVNLDECASYPCLNGSTCIDGVFSFQCVCAAGFEHRCEDKVPNLSVISSNFATKGFVSKVDGSALTCKQAADQSITGVGCSFNLDEFDHKGLQLKDFCVKTCYNCGGPNVWHQCEIDIDECDSSPCMNGSTCQDSQDHGFIPVDKYTCTCIAGYSGAICETDIGECLSRPCLNGSTCTEGVDTYSCACVDGWSGYNCLKDDNECGSYPCQNGGLCQDSAGTAYDFAKDVSVANGEYLCHCRPGWSGVNCAQDVNECVSTPCMNGATCMDSTTDSKLKENLFNCICAPGWGGKMCHIDLDECASHPCLNAATCVDAVYAFACICRVGFVGFICENDFYECASKPCKNGGQCYDSSSRSVHAGQKEGVGSTVSVDVTSKFADILADQVTGASRDNLLTAEELGNDKDGKILLAALKAQIATQLGISPSSVAIESIGTQSYVASKGRRLQVKTQYQAPIDSDSFICICLKGYSGYLCQDDIDECASGPCFNGGTCAQGVDSYTCTCAAGYMDVPEGTCLTNLNECASVPCIHGATCSEGIDTYTCICDQGYSGYNCEVNDDECNSSPCMNGSTCTDLVDAYECTCMGGWSGGHCELEVDPCPSGTNDCDGLRA